MKRRLGLSMTAIVAVAVGTGCANQSDGAAPVRPPIPVSAVAAASDAGSWVGPQRDPGVDSSWAGAQTVAGLIDSWVGPQIAAGLDSSWAGPQAAPVPTSPTSAVATTSLAAEAPPVEPTAPGSADSEGAPEFAAASPEVVAAVSAAVGQTEMAYAGAVANMADPAQRELVAATTVDGSSAEQLFLEWYDLMTAEGYWYVPPTDGVDATTVMPEPQITVDSSGMMAIVTVCSVSGGTIMDHDAANVEVALSTGWSAYEQLQIFVLSDDRERWLLADVLDLAAHPGEKSCIDPQSSSIPSASSPDS